MHESNPNDEPTQRGAGSRRVGFLATETQVTAHALASLTPGLYYTLRNGAGTSIGKAVQDTRKRITHVLKFLSIVQDFGTISMAIHDETDSPVVHINRPMKLLRSRFYMNDIDGSNIAVLWQTKSLGKIAFIVESGAKHIGKIRATNVQCSEFIITDNDDTQIGEVSVYRRKIDSQSLSPKLIHSSVYVHPSVPQPTKLLFLLSGVCVLISGVTFTVQSSGGTA